MRSTAPPRIATLLARAGTDGDGEQMACPSLQLATAARFASAEQARASMAAAPGRQTGYRRHGNTTVLQLEAAFSALQQGASCVAVASGMAASMAIFATLLRSGDHVIMPCNVFYETAAQLERVSHAAGIGVSRVDGGSVMAIVAAFRPETRLVLVESPSNPGLVTLDIPALVAACHARRILLVVDNTLLTPLAQNVLALGVDLSIYSMSKHLSGHGDVIGGMVCTRSPELHAQLIDWRICAGSGIDPFSAWLALRGLRSLPARLRSHAGNAMSLGRMLERRFPWLTWRGVWQGPHARRNRVSPRLHTGLMALVFDDAATAARFVASLHDIPVLPTFGNPETGVFHYGGIIDDPGALAACGIPAGLVRLAVGIEDWRDLQHDIGQALLRCRHD